MKLNNQKILLTDILDLIFKTLWAIRNQMFQLMLHY